MQKYLWVLLFILTVALASVFGQDIEAPGRGASRPKLAAVSLRAGVTFNISKRLRTTVTVATKPKRSRVSVHGRRRLAAHTPSPRQHFEKAQLHS
jgi:hypothetical protein